MSVTGAWNELSPRESGAPTNPARVLMESESHSVVEARMAEPRRCPSLRLRQTRAPWW